MPTSPELGRQIGATVLVRKLTETESTDIVPDASPPVWNDEMNAVSNVHLRPVAVAGSVALSVTLRDREPNSQADFNCGVAQPGLRLGFARARLAGRRLDDGLVSE
jgi:hypothetical protein